jgi:hypothetical protein
MAFDRGPAKAFQDGCHVLITQRSAPSMLVLILAYAM